MTVIGKGFYIWAIRRVEAGNVQAIANVAAQAGLTHALIKIADGTNPYNINTDGPIPVDLVPPLVQALAERGIQSLGWHYVYGHEPEAEATIALQRISQTGVTMYVIDAEDEYKLPGRDATARQFMSRLRAALPVFPMALSSYRYPTYHPAFPFQAFLESVDFNMPQVYWVDRHDPGDQLARCLREFQAISPFRPIIPTGSAYLQGNWQPTPDDVIEFMDTARNLSMPAANFWEWGHTWLYLPELWDTIADYEWSGGPPDADIVARYFGALNSHDPQLVSSLYAENAVHVLGSRTIQGHDRLEAWYNHLFTVILPGGVFYKVEESGRSGSRRFTWTAAASTGDVLNGSDAFGLADGKIVYHFSSFSVTP